MGIRSLILMTLSALCVMAAGSLMASAPALALEEHAFSGTFGSEGSGPGQFDEPLGVAVNDTTHNVYVTDTGNKRVEEFTAAGVYIREIIPPGVSGGPSYSGPEQIAVDNSGNPLDPSAGDVYVTDSGLHTVYKFSEDGKYIGQVTEGGHGEFGQIYGVAVDSTGALWVLGDEQNSPWLWAAEDFSDADANTFIESGEVERGSEGMGGAGIRSFAVGLEDDLYVPEGSLVREYNRHFEEINEAIGPKEVGFETGFAFDTQDNELYLASPGRPEEAGNAARPDKVEGYGLNGVLNEVLGSEHEQLTGFLGGVGVDSASNAVYAIERTEGKVAIFDQILVPDVSTGVEPTNLEHEGSVTLDGTVDPDGEAVTSCLFEYGTTASYGETAACEEAPGDGSESVTVHAEVSGLTPLARYHYRLIVGNAQGSDAGYDETFTAPAAPTIASESVSDVVSNAATLQADVDPGGADTTYRFEYGPTASYGMSLPIPDGDAGSGSIAGEIGVRAQSLLPDATYHFRVVVGNAVQGEVAGRDQEFTTQPAGTEFVLPDGRQWELVSPPSKHGAGFFTAGIQQGAVIQAAEAGGAITYVANGPLVAAPPGNRSLENTQVFSERGPSGWETQDIATPNTEVGGLFFGTLSEYKLFSGNLSLGLVEPKTNTALPPLPEGSERTPYLREDFSNEYEPLLTAANTPKGAEYGKQDSAEDKGVVFEGGSPDLHHVILASEHVPLLADAGAGDIYEESEGQLQLVSLLPAGEGGAATEGELGNADRILGGEGKIERHAVSDDGARVVWTGAHAAPGEEAGARHLYLRDMAKGETIRLDVAQEGAVGGDGEPEDTPRFETANSEDTRIFFYDKAPLTKESSGRGNDFYVFEVTSGGSEPLKGRLTDLTVDENVGESAEVQGSVIGASEDGTAVYFVAEGVLGDAGEHGAERGENLYLESYAGDEKWTAPRFIAKLAEEGDEPDWASYGSDFKHMTARVSPNGRYLAFMSEARLTGYDNRDANSGEPDEEVFLYDAGSSRLVCASCNPTGARPIGMRDSGVYGAVLVDEAQNWPGRWLAASIPGWDNFDSQEAFYQPRYLSDDGRLFFDSVDPLVPADVNGKENVYEYEPTGVGSCTDASEGAGVVFSEGLGGCVALISSGTSSEESAFLDASEGGGEVFFLTSARLLPQDYDNAFDVYDAHECTGESPCAAAGAVVPPACTTAEACRAAPTPQPALFGAPSSATFSGAGNIVPAATSPASTKTRSLTRGQKLAKALQACRKDAKKRRSECEAQASKKYGPKKTRAKGKARVKSKAGAGKSLSTETRR